MWVKTESLKSSSTPTASYKSFSVHTLCYSTWTTAVHVLFIPLIQTDTVLGNYILNSSRTRSVLYLSDFSLAQWMLYGEKRFPLSCTRVSEEWNTIGLYLNRLISVFSYWLIHGEIPISILTRQLVDDEARWVSTPFVFMSFFISHLHFDKSLHLR